MDRTGHLPHHPGGAARRVSVSLLAAPSGHRAAPGTIEPMRLLSTPSRLYRVLALAEVVTWTLLLGGMFVKYVLDSTELLVRIGGGLHGFTFLCYVVVTVLVAVDQRWKLTDLLLGLASAIIPDLTVPGERSARGAGPHRPREGGGPRAAATAPGGADHGRGRGGGVLDPALAGPAHRVVRLS